MDKFNIALIGAGRMGGCWAEVISRLETVRLKAVVDLDLEKAQKISGNFDGCMAFKDWNEVVGRFDIDACIICLPHSLLAPASKAALEGGIHVLCEKPCAITLCGLREVIFLADEKGLCFMPGFNHRFHEAIIHMKGIYDSGGVGEIMFLKAEYGFGGREGYEKEWRHNKGISGGGELIDQGIHLIDLACVFLGEIRETKAILQDAFWNSGVEDNAFVLLKNYKNKIASFHVSWTMWEPRFVFEIFGKKGFLRMEGLWGKYRDADLIWHSCESDSVCMQRFTFPPDNNSSLVGELNEFISAIKESRKPIPCGNDALEALKIVKNIYKEEARI